MNKTLSPTQQKVIDWMRKNELDFLAHSTREFWEGGRAYYIDSRVKVPRWIKKQFAEGNREAAK